MQEQEQATQDKAKIWADLEAEDAGAPAAPADSGAPEQTVQADVAAATQSAAPQAALDQVAADDAYQGLPDAVRHELAGLKAIAGQLADRLRNAEGHIGGLNSKLQAQARSAATAATAQGEEAPSATQIRNAKGSAKAMATLIEDYPEFGAAMKGAIDEEVIALRQEIAQLRPSAEPAGVTPADLRTLRSELAVEGRHPGWQDTVRTPQFVGWLQGQAREFHMLAASDSPQDAIRLLDAYGGAQASGSQRKQRLDSAAALPTGRAQAVRSKPVEQMGKAEYWSYLDSMDQQKVRS